MFSCKACASKDAEITYLRAALNDLHRASLHERDEMRKDLLAVADRNAASQRSPRAPAEPAPPLLTTPAQIRGTTYKEAKELTPEEIEATFKQPEPSAPAQ